MEEDAPRSAGRGSACEVLWAFLRLGCTSFGGPVAHIGYFHEEFVNRRRWCDEAAFAEIVALAQAMPGPASSQVGFSLGLLRAGYAGGAAAWLGFTMPSALLMLAFAFGHGLLTGKIGAGVIHGLQLVAVAVVAQAVVAMRRTLAPDIVRVALALAAAGVVYFTPGNYGTLLAMALGAVTGRLLLRRAQAGEVTRPLVLRVSKRMGAAAGLLFCGLLLALDFGASGQVAGSGTAKEGVEVFNAFFRSGALVFGGGHVVLPLLEQAVVARGWVDQPSFLAGYGAAQALPGPLFTFAAYLGAVVRPAAHPVLNSALALAGIFMPGLLIILAVLPWWSELRRRSGVQAALRGINAAVVGVLLSAFVRPVCTSAVHTLFDTVVAGAALLVLVRWKLAPWMVVIGVAAISAVAAAI